MRFLGGLILSAAIAGQAVAFSKKEIADAGYHWARVDFAAEECDRLGVNERISRAARATLEKSGDDAWKAGYDLGRSEASAYFEGSGAEAFCELSWVFYGRDGQAIKNLLVRN